MLTSRERVALALNHREPDKVPLDLAGCASSGLHHALSQRGSQAAGRAHIHPPPENCAPFIRHSKVG